jgi:hypothetical protein
MKAIAAQRRDLRRAVLPKPIDSQTVFALDIDDDIWQDVGLEDDDNYAPPWLADDNVRKGIRILVLHDRCIEEKIRLQKECTAMKEWVSEEWQVIQLARKLNGMS